MQMAADDVARVRYQRLVREHERWLRDWPVDAGNVDRRTRITRSLVVIAAHEKHVDRRVATPPFAHDARGLRLASLARMKEIAEEDDPARTGTFEGCVQSDERSRGRAAWNRNTCRAKRSRFAKVRVRDEQRPPALPVRHTFREQHDAVARDLDHCVTIGFRHRHPAAFSSASCMRRMRSVSDSDDTRSRARSTTSGNPNGVTRFGWLT